MKTFKKKITALKINPTNPREIGEKEFDDLVRSLLTFPKMLDTREIVDDNGVILGGNMRCRGLLAILDLSLDRIREIVSESRKFKHKTEAEIDVVVEYWADWKANPIVDVKDGSEFTEEEKREFVIKDNVSYGSWDFDALGNEWESADLDDWGLNVWTDEPEEEKEDKDLSDKVSSAFEVVVSCESETEQERIFNEFKERGLKCRVLTL